MLRRVFVALAMLTLTALVLALVAGRGAWAGRELVGIGTHGLHLGDVPILAAWITAAGWCWWIWRRE